mgnify:FL=1
MKGIIIMATAKKAPCKKAPCKKVACKKAAAPAKKEAPAKKPAAPKVVKITKTPTKAAIIDMVAEKVQITKPQAKAAIEAVVEIAYNAAKNAKDGFVLPGIGKLLVKKQGARKCRNPKTGETIKIKAKNVVKFRVAKAAKDAILG